MDARHSCTRAVAVLATMAYLVSSHSLSRNNKFQQHYEGTKVDRVLAMMTMTKGKKAGDDTPMQMKMKRMGMVKQNMHPDKKERPSKSMSMTVKGEKSSMSYKSIKEKKDASGKGGSNKHADKKTKGSMEKHSKKMHSTKSSMKKIMLKSMMGKGKGKGGTTTPPPTNFPTQAPLPGTATPTGERTTSSPTATTNEPTTSPTTPGPTVSPTLSPTGPSGRPEFCFDPNDETCGPDVWPDLDTEGNQCGGSRNSPIAIPSLDFCEPVDYVFSVSHVTIHPLCICTCLDSPAELLTTILFLHLKRLAHARTVIWNTSSTRTRSRPPTQIPAQLLVSSLVI